HDGGNHFQDRRDQLVVSVDEARNTVDHWRHRVDEVGELGQEGRANRQVEILDRGLKPRDRATRRFQTALKVSLYNPFGVERLLPDTAVLFHVGEHWLEEFLHLGICEELSHQLL